MYRIFFYTMAFEKWTLLYSALLLLVSMICKVEAQSCGGTYNTTYGVFMSPNYPNVYNLNTQCNYTISLSTISSITLNFETFELDRSGGDYVSITCGSNSSYKEKKYPWDSNIPPISISWCSDGRLDFVSDWIHDYSTRGFKVQYQVNTKGCGNTVFTYWTGNISSPNYPQNYSNNENCTYSIWAHVTSSFTLSVNAFQLESESESDCIHDWVQIWCDNSSYILPKYCGSTLPKPVYISNCNKVLIWFHTDSSTVYSGFSLQYTITFGGCGKLNYAGLSGIITSPNYPKSYYINPSDPYCSYYLYAVSSVALEFQAFDLEPFIDISHGDRVEIECYSNSSYGSSKYYGNTLPPLISYTLCSRVHIELRANDALYGTGFNIRYQVNPLVAHGAITNTPKNVTVDVGSQVQLDCTSNATGYYPSWTLSIDGTDENTAVIASFCVVNYLYTSEYSVVKGGPGVCNLVIRRATLAEAGNYTCIDVSLASASSVVTVVELVPTTTPTSDQDQTDYDFIFLGVILAIGYIAVASFFIALRCKEISREEEGQRNTNQDMRPGNHSMATQATRSVYEGLPAYALSPDSSSTSTRNVDSSCEHLNHGLDNPPAYNAITT